MPVPELFCNVNQPYPPQSLTIQNRYYLPQYPVYNTQQGRNPQQKPDSLSDIPTLFEKPNDVNAKKSL